MTFTPQLPYPVAIWSEWPQIGAATLLLLTPYLLTDGSVRFLAPADAVPAGAVRAAVVDSGLGYDAIVAPPTIPARRVVMRGAGLILFL